MTTRKTYAALGLAVVAALAVAAWMLAPSASVVPSASPLPGRSVGWQLDHGYGGPKFDPSMAMTTTVVPIEVNYPVCITNGQDHWFDATVSYTPVSVTIQVRMTALGAAMCPAASAAPAASQPRSSLPLLSGNYLSGIYYAVQLREPLAGRALFDGSTFPASPRPYP